MTPSRARSILGLVLLLALTVAPRARAQGSGPADGSLPAEFLKEMDSGSQTIPPPPSGTPGANGAPSVPPTSQPAVQPAPGTPPPASPPATPPAVSERPAPSPSQPALTPGGSIDPNLGGGAHGFSGGTALSNEEYVYDPTGRRDPFKPYRVIRTDSPKLATPTAPADLLEPLQRLEIETLSIVGILWDVRQPRALVRDQSGNLHTLVRNTKVGRNNGYVAAIREGEIVVIETVEEEGRAIKRTKVLELKRAEK